MQFKIILSFIAVCIFFIVPTHAETVRRAAFDIGSGGTSLTVADVDLETNKIVEILYQDAKGVALRADLAQSSDGNLSQEIQVKLIDALKQFKDEIAALQPKQWVGIGTSVFRQAKNGAAVLQNASLATDIPLHLASQDEEGRIGFTTAAAVSGLDPSVIIAWDLGAGSFQLTALKGAEFDVYGEEFSLIGILELLVKEIRGEALDTGISPNPITSDEFSLLVSKIQKGKLPQVPDWLAKSDKQIIAFGTNPCLFSLGQIVTGKGIYTQGELLEAIQHLLEKTDDQLSVPHKKVVPLGMILIYSIMNHIHLDKIVFVPTNGNCEGTLIMPQYWEAE